MKNFLKISAIFYLIVGALLIFSFFFFEDHSYINSILGLFIYSICFSLLFGILTLIYLRKPTKNLGTILKIFSLLFILNGATSLFFSIFQSNISKTLLWSSTYFYQFFLGYMLFSYIKKTKSLASLKFD